MFDRKTYLRSDDTNAYLLYEGPQDFHVIRNLCARHQIAEDTFTFHKSEVEGIDRVLENIHPMLKRSNLRALGVVLDANEHLIARWNAVRDQLLSYDNPYGNYTIPAEPPPNGWISTSADLPKAGVWLMPDNRLTGTLEGFVAELIPPDDDLQPKAERVLQEIEQDGSNRYSLAHHQKALIHTWLAWQKRPGRPMGEAITAKVLSHDTPMALEFIGWLKRLFAPTG